VPPAPGAPHGVPAWTGCAPHTPLPAHTATEQALVDAGQSVEARHCTHVALPLATLQNGAPVGQSLSVCFWPSAAHARTRVDVTHVASPARQLSHCLPTESHRPA
jgi:hypothetical protein